ncbi:hypothetical protein HY988_00775 [Candidatus Micrarchaeota archaeon]|nr:hypothetical protein [Candidatus Micrarchaeota archaeon]
MVDVFTTIKLFWGDWLAFAGIAFGIVTCLIGGVYMIGSMLMNDKIKAWAKMELAELFYSAIILSFAITSLPLVDGVVHGAILLMPHQGIGNNPQPSPGTLCPGATTATTTYVQQFRAGQIPLVNNGIRDYACIDICGDDIAENQYSVYNGISSCSVRMGIWHLREVFDETSTFAFNTYIDYIWTSMAAEFTINFETIFEKTGFITFNPWRGFFTMGNNVKSLAFEWAMKILMITKMQEIFLRFIALAIFPSFFVAGTLLRTFTFTRRLGGLMLAIAIALYFIYPTFYAFAGLVMIQLKDNVRDDWVSPLNVKANPLGKLNPDPPIANTMYILGFVPVIGGGNKLDTRGAQQTLANIQGYSGVAKEGVNPYDLAYLETIEKNDPATNKLIPRFNAGPGDDPASKDPAVVAEQQKALAAAEKAFDPTDRDSWFGQLSQASKQDSWINFSWEPNGPLDILARLSFWSMFFSLLAIISTIAAIRSLSMTFGGDIEIAGLTRLI